MIFPLIVGVGGKGGGDDAPGIGEDDRGGFIVTTDPAGFGDDKKGVSR